ncbi:MAG: c-type cytochrome, partial [Chitinophagales bacterium]
MRKIIAMATILTGITVAAYFMACNNNKQEPQANSKEDSVKKVIARGDYLANHVTPCLDCHSKRDFTKFSGPIVPGTEGMGGEVFDSKLLPGVPGTIYARNITPDPETGIGTWTDDEIMRAMTQGISKNGDTLFPIMPYVHFNHMAKEDLLSIIAYIKTLKPIKNKVPARQLMIPISMAYPGPALAKSVDGNMSPPESDPVKYGEYLVNAAVCSDCHTPMVKGQYDFSKFLAGGNTFNLETFTVTTANITPDSATGIGAWDETRFMNKFTVYRDEKGYNYDPGKANTMMPLTTYAGMTDADLKAIHAYLQTIKPIKNLVVKYPK